MTQDGRHSAGQREQLGVGDLRSEQQDRNGTLGNVEQRDRDGVLPSENPVEIGGAEIAAAVLSEIDFGEESADEIAGRDGAEKIGGEKPERRPRASASRPSPGELEPQGRAGKRPGFPEAVRQIALIRLGYLVRPVAHDGEGGRSGADL